MFRRIIVEDWERTLSLVGWLLFALVFVSAAIRAVLMPKEAVRKMENLPLENESHD